MPMKPQTAALPEGNLYESKQVKRTFYCRKPGLCIHINKGQKVPTGSGGFERIGQKHANFSPVNAASNNRASEGGTGQWGSLSTDDPEIIEVLSRKCKEPNTDIFDETGYGRASVTEGEQILNMRREIQTKNRLIEKLQGQIAAD